MSLNPNLLPSTCFWVGAAICHTVMEVMYMRYDQSIFSVLSKNRPQSWFGKESWKLKYKFIEGFGLVPARKNLYTNFFHVKYRERFSLSSTLLVWVTDAYHFFQFLMITFLTLSVLSFTWNHNPDVTELILTFIGYRVLWSMTFTAFFDRVLMK